MTSYEDFGRQGMLSRHSVFKVHDIPPAAYYGPGIPSGVIPEFRAGDVCSRGLWDEAVDAPVAYPFLSDREGFCYLPNYTGPFIPHKYSELSAAVPLVLSDKNKPQLPPKAHCGLACQWAD